jgi:hypothetical protein
VTSPMLRNEFFQARTLPTADMVAAHRALQPAPVITPRTPRPVFSQLSVGRTRRIICLADLVPAVAIELPAVATKWQDTRGDAKTLGVTVRTVLCLSTRARKAGHAIAHHKRGPKGPT